MHQTCGVRFPCGSGIRRDGIVRWVVSAEVTPKFAQIKYSVVHDLSGLIRKRD